MMNWHDKVLLITGGTGSFGNAVLNRFLKTDIGEIRIFSRDEKKQDDMRHDFQAKMPEVAGKIKFYIGDVRDLSSIKNAMHGVNYIFHAAALKQVPSCEFFPMEAVRTNVIGTDNVLTAAIDEGVEFIELAAPVKQAKGMLLCDKMVLGEPDTSGRRSPVKSGEQFSIPCDLVLSAVGEQVDSDLMAANGIEMERKGPAFETNVEGVYCAGDAHRGPATVVEGIADAARFAEAVVGAPYEYEIPAQAFITEADAIAKHGILKMSGKCEGERCLQCSTVCENCVDSCPNRANVAVVMPDESHQIIHVDKMCNECGNCTQFCPYASEPCHDKFTLFQTAEDMAESKNPGVLFLDADHVRVRMAEERDYDLTTSDNDLPVDIEALIFTIRDKYSYLFA